MYIIICIYVCKLNIIYHAILVWYLCDSLPEHLSDQYSLFGRCSCYIQYVQRGVVVLADQMYIIWKNALSGQEKEVRFRCAHEKERG